MAIREGEPYGLIKALEEQVREARDEDALTMGEESTLASMLLVYVNESLFPKNPDWRGECGV